MPSLKNKKILIGVTAGIAAYKIPTLVRLLVKGGAQVKVILTPSALRFVTAETLAVVSKNAVYSEFFENENGEWNNHVDFGIWPDLMIIAPLTATSLGKMVSGISDNLVLASYLSARCPVMIAPAMDLDMYQSEPVKTNLQILSGRDHILLNPGVGELASGLIGEGRMMEPEDIFMAVTQFFTSNLPLEGKKVLVTAGPTYENIDPVRFIGNYSTGKMGYAIAEAFEAQGAEVYLVSGPTALQNPNGVTVQNVVSADEMYHACTTLAPNMDIVVMAAAVADYKPVNLAFQKIKKSGEYLDLKLVKNKDILEALGKTKLPGQTIVGFALETENEDTNAKEKMVRKKADAIILNSLRNQASGFGYDTNQVTMHFPNLASISLPLMQKTEIATHLVSQIINLHLNKNH